MALDAGKLRRGRTERGHPVAGGEVAAIEPAVARAVARRGVQDFVRSYRALYESEVLPRIAMVVDGLPAVDAKRLLDMPVLGRAAVLSALDLPVATFNKKVKAQDRLTTSEGERVVGFARLVGQVEAMVRDAGEVPDFDARAWLARWLSEPLPALGHVPPLELMRTMEGQALVSNTLAMAVSGAYA